MLCRLWSSFRRASSPPSESGKTSIMAMAVSGAVSTRVILNNTCYPLKGASQSGFSALDEICVNNSSQRFVTGFMTSRNNCSVINQRLSTRVFELVQENLPELTSKSAAFSSSKIALTKAQVTFAETDAYLRSGFLEAYRTTDTEHKKVESGNGNEIKSFPLEGSISKNGPLNVTQLLCRLFGDTYVHLKLPGGFYKILEVILGILSLRTGKLSAKYSCSESPSASMKSACFHTKEAHTANLAKCYSSSPSSSNVSRINGILPGFSTGGSALKNGNWSYSKQVKRSFVCSASSQSRIRDNSCHINTKGKRSWHLNKGQDLCCPSRISTWSAPVNTSSDNLSSSQSSYLGSTIRVECSIDPYQEEEPSISDGSHGNGVYPSPSAPTAGMEPPEPDVGVAVLKTSANLHGGVSGTEILKPVKSGSRRGVKIHPSAHVHDDAVLEEGVEIGPLCTVGPGARLGPNCKLHVASHVFGSTEIGEGCTLLSGAIVGADLPGTTVIGSDNTIGHHAVVGVRCQDMKYKEGSPCFLKMGNGNDIREHTSIHRSSRPDDVTEIGDNNLIMGSCHVAHDCRLGSRNILANGTLLGGHVVMEDFVHTGGAVAVHQFCHIGAYSFLAGGSMVARDVPVYTMVAGDRAELRGLNLEGMRRCGFSDVQVRGIRKAYQKLFLATDPTMGLEDRLTALELDLELSSDSAVVRLLVSVRASFQENRRGICKFRHWTTADQ